MAQIPVTLLTGFLGAGKTTRLNATLQAGTARIAVIENEIGSLGVDGSLVSNVHDDGVIELTNGCLCCSGDIDLIGALEALATRSQSRPFDHVIIETTGLADVGPVVALLRDRDDALASDFVFNAVITVVDAASFKSWAATRTGDGKEHSARVEAFWKQVAFADRIIISKADRVDAAELLKLDEALMSANPLAERSTDNSAAPLPLAPLTRPPLPARPWKRFCGTPSRHNLQGVETLAIRPESQLKQGPLRELLGRLLEPRREASLGEAWRIKGLLLVDGSMVLVQGVGDQLEMDPWSGDAEPILVFIGAGLQQARIEEALQACAS